MKRPDFFSRLLLGATDMEDIETALSAARDRKDVHAVFLDVDSPGGTVNGTPELAALVAAVSKAKYTYAFTDGQMCSAAYWIASQADAIYATPSARVGSIGVLLPMLDDTKAFAQAGLKVELFAAGKYKSVGVPGVSLTDEQRVWLQADVDEIYADFKTAVLARGRKIPPEAMEGQCLSSRRAQYNSLISGVVDDRAEAFAKLHGARRTKSLRAERFGGLRRDFHTGHAVDIPAVIEMKTIDEQLEDALARVKQLEADAQAGSTLLGEAANQADDLKQKTVALAAHADELKQQLAALDAAKENLTLANTELIEQRDQLASDLATAKQSLTSAANAAEELAKAKEQIAALSAEVETLKANAKSAERIAAERYGAASPQPLPVTSRGDSKANELLTRFKAITNPAEQTAFWRSLTPEQRTLIQNAK